MADEAIVRVKKIEWRDEPAGALQTLARPFGFTLEVFNYPNYYPQDATVPGATIIRGKIFLLGYDDFLTLAAKKDFLNALIEIQATVIEEDDTSKLITVNNATIIYANIVCGNKAGIKKQDESSPAVVEYRYDVRMADPFTDDVSDYVTIE